MMGTLKKCWITEHDAGLVVLSLESSFVDEEYKRIHTYEMTFPESSKDPNRPRRHVTTIELLDQDDINMLAQLLDKYRDDL